MECLGDLEVMSFWCELVHAIRYCSIFQRYTICQPIECLLRQESNPYNSSQARTSTANPLRNAPAVLGNVLDVPTRYDALT